MRMNLAKASAYSEQIISDIRERLSRELEAKDIAVVTVGSFARKEASQQSDLDFFILVEEPDEVRDGYVKDIIEKALKENNVRNPSEGGAFNSVQRHTDLTSNLGGFDDDGESLTRRLLFLLESDWLYNEELFNRLFNELVDVYVKDKITDHQICRFLLNDLVRYYRTICVDFEYKTSERGKSWGDRNIKLLFSRKLMYFGGVLAVAETAQHAYKEKRRVLIDSLRQTPVERLRTICGDHSSKILDLYDAFIHKMSDERFRGMLQGTTIDRKTHSDEFRFMKNTGHHFSWELARLLKDAYDSAHPIHHALLF